MNNYTQKVDKVGTDEVFPYPIKLTYDNEYIYLTVLRIPEYYELKANPFAMNAVKIIQNKPNWYSFYSPNDHMAEYLCTNKNTYLSHLWLCVETLDTSKKHYKSRRRTSDTVRKYVCKSRDYRYNNVTVGTTYNFPITSVLTSYQHFILDKKGVAYITVRGTFRYGGQQFGECGRTSIVSNQTKIEYSK